MLNEDLKRFIVEHAGEDVNGLALQRNRYSEFTDADFSFALQQIDGRQRTHDKLPSLCNYSQWLFPKRLSMEQCSSEETARYKSANIISGLLLCQREGSMLVDLTGGMGVDTLFMAENFEEVHYVERDEELCRLARHNFSLITSRVQVHCMAAELFLKRMQQKTDVIYIDPARRTASGKKVFRLQDCEPNVIELMPVLRERCRMLILKLSPMLDLTVALNALPETREIHVVAVKGEVKEVIFCLNLLLNETIEDNPAIRCVNLESADEEFMFTRQQEKNTECKYTESIGEYLYEPNAAILKAGAFKTVAARYSLEKLSQHTHLYTSDVLQMTFPGRVWRMIDKFDMKTAKGMKLNILSRNYPISAEDLRKRYNIKDGGNNWLIATRLGSKPIVFLAERLR